MVNLSSLSSLLDDTSHAAAEEQVVLIKLDAIIAQDQVRSQTSEGFNAESIDDLKASIEAIGLQTPIIVRPNPDTAGTYIIVCGERRFRAFKALNRVEIPCFIKTFNSEHEIIIYQLSENLQRVDLTTYEQATTIKNLSMQDLSNDEIAKFLGKKNSYVSMMKSIADNLPDFIIKLNQQEKISDSYFLLYQLSKLAKKENLSKIKEFIEDVVETKEFFDRSDLDPLKRYLASFNHEENFSTNTSVDVMENSLTDILRQEGVKTLSHIAPSQTEQKVLEESSAVADIVSYNDEKSKEELETDSSEYEHFDVDVENDSVENDVPYNDTDEENADACNEQQALFNKQNKQVIPLSVTFNVIYQNKEYFMQLFSKDTCVLFSKDSKDTFKVKYNEIKLLSIEKWE